MTKIQELIKSALRESDMEPSLKEFFLSRRPAIIYGAGNQGSILRGFCKVFRKKVLGFLISSGDNSLSACGVTDECHSLDKIPGSWVSGEVDCIIALGEEHREKVADALQQAGMPNIIQVQDWKKENGKLTEARSLFFDKVDILSQSISPIWESAQKKNFYIHIGMAKCGSSSIQSFLCKNRDALKKEGFFYPETVNGHDMHAELLANAPNLFPFYCTRSQNIIIDDALSQQAKNIIFSCELFIGNYNNLPEILRKRGNYICYLRSPLSHAHSNFLEPSLGVVQSSPYSLYFCDVINILRYVSLQRAELEKFFSSGETRSRTHLRSFDLAVKGKGLCADFLEAIGLAADVSSFAPAAIENTGLLAPYFLFLGHVSQLPLSRDALWQIMHECYVLSAQDKRFPRYRFFSKRQIAEIPVELIHWYEELGKEMGDPDFWQRGEEALLKLEQCPYDQLPEDLQYDIFERLSAQSQKAILDVWPLRREIPDRLWGSAFLPDIPSTKAEAEFMRSWMRALRPVSV